MTNEQKIRFAVVGAGHIGLRQAGLIRRNPDCELVALCDPQPGAGTDIASYMSNTWSTPRFSISPAPP